MPEQESSKEYGGGSYGKRPLWQWIVIYLIIGAVVYGLIYYFFLSKKSGYSYNSATPTVAEMQKINPTSTTSAAPANNIYLSKTSPSLGVYLTDFAGMTLYVFDKDKQGVSNCYGGCATLWPPYSSGATAQGSFPANITVLKRTDGSSQFAWKGMPLYYYAKDTKAGDVLGDGVGGVWHLVKPQ